MLARTGALLVLEAQPVRSPILNDLKELSMAREALVKDRTAAKNGSKNLTLSILKRHNAAQFRQIERRITATEAEIMALVRAEPDLARRIRGGRINVRQALYMPALVATRRNPDLKAKYDKFKAAGKASKIAITAIMPKLVVLANALIRDGRKWTPSPS